MSVSWKKYLNPLIPLKSEVLHFTSGFGGTGGNYKIVVLNYTKWYKRKHDNWNTSLVAHSKFEKDHTLL